MSGHSRRNRLIGRTREQQALAKLLDGARRGRSGVLVLRGEAGVGKTALLADVLADAGDFRVLQISGAESEMELAYAGVQQLCAPLSGLIDRLPEPQSNALRIALGLETGSAPDRLLVGLAMLTLLGEASGERPTVCVVDDAQWVDTASLQALAVVARRILAEPLVMFFATRAEGADLELAGQPELVLRRLDDHHARELLAAMVPGRLNDRVLENVLLEANGNPLALLELHRELTPSALAGGYGLTDATSAANRVETTFGRRLREVPAATRTLLLIAAAEPAGRDDWLWRCAELLDVDAEAAAPAEAAGLVTLDRGIRFRHPLIRAAVYRTAAPAERRRVHAALASAIGGWAADDYRAWHRAHAAQEPSEQVADELERSARRANARGGVAAAAAFLDYAANLTPDPMRRAQRALDAAQAKLVAGAPEAASRLLTLAQESTEDEYLSARRELLRARLVFVTNRGTDAPPLLMAAAQKLEHLDPSLARETYLDALMSSILVGRLGTERHGSAVAIAAEARKAPPAPSPARAVDLLLDGLVVRLTDGHTAAISPLQNAIREFLREQEAGLADPHWHDLTHRVCLDLFDQDTYNFLISRQVEALRAAGALTVLPVALVTHAGMCVTAGQFTKAAALLEESAVIIEATGAPVPGSIHTYLAAYRGQEQLCRKLVQTTIAGATTRGEGYEISVAQYAAAILHNGLGQYAEAIAAASSGAAYDDIGIHGYLLTELVEAAARGGEAATAEDAFRRLSERTQASGTDTALGVAARSAALVSDGRSAEAEYQRAIAHLQRSPAVVYLARTQLIYGEWLRRMKRRADARIQLRIAHDMFVQMGADGFTRRARRELTAAGEIVHASHGGAVAALTAQESHIASLASDGYTNSEIASHLFISPRTVEWHLSRIFAKLGVASRRDLRSAPALMQE